MNLRRGARAEHAEGKSISERGYGFSRVPMSLRLTQGDENHSEVVFDCAVNRLRA